MCNPGQEMGELFCLVRYFYVWLRFLEPYGAYLLDVWRTILFS